MRTKGIALHGMAVLAGGLIATSAMAQTQMASAVPAPQRDVLVFTDKGGQLSPTAASTVRSIAAEAKASRVTLVGRPENVAPVKAALETARRARRRHRRRARRERQPAPDRPTA